MTVKTENNIVRYLCFSLFTIFAVNWLFVFERELIHAGCLCLLQTESTHSSLLLNNEIICPSLLLVVTLLLVIPSVKLLRFTGGLYACNYLIPALFLGFITGFDMEGFWGQSSSQMIIVLIGAVMLFVICKIVSTIPKSQYNALLRAVTGNLLIMLLLFCIVGTVGNTDEILHRQLRMEQLYEKGNYNKLLEVGRYEEESNIATDLLRAQAMLALPCEHGPQGSEIGERLFDYSISEPQELAHILCSVDDTQAYLAGCLLCGDIASFADSINLYEYKELPKYYVQALVLNADSLSSTLFPEQYAREQELYESMLESLKLVEDKPLQLRANSTYIQYHNTYYWYYMFR